METRYQSGWGLGVVGVVGGFGCCGWGLGVVGGGWVLWEGVGCCGKGLGGGRGLGVVGGGWV
jgi:hypothetical protein